MPPGFSPAITIHVIAALAALLIGGWIFLRRKGTFVHRVLGRVWVVLMLVTAISTWWIRSSGSFSWIHGLSVITLVALVGAIVAVMRGNVDRHRQAMVSLYVGALVVAGAFTLLPSRLLGNLLWTALGVVG